MYSFGRAVKTAVIEDSDDFDTQACHFLQDQVFLSPPDQDEETDAASSVSFLPATTLLNSAPTATANVAVAEPDAISGNTANTNTVDAVPEENGNDAPSSSKSLIFYSRKNPQARNRRFHRKGGQGRPPSATMSGREQQQEMKMGSEPGIANDLTQGSSLSLTQENSLSAYEATNIQRSIVAPLRALNEEENVISRGRLPAIDKDVGMLQQENSNVIGQDHSTPTESTILTSKTNDPDHIVLGFDELANTNEFLDGESQDASYTAPPQIEDSPPTHPEPQTPAPAVNPFKYKGSVLKGPEMFGATQPSSVGRHFASPASSRPSPDVYTFNAPAANRNISSPLAEQTLGQSAVSFDATFLRRKPVFEPRRYNSMKESQERREKNIEPDSESDTDSDIEPEPKKKRDREIRELMNAAKMRFGRPRISSPTLARRQGPSHLKSSSPPSIEVPSTSTGRRRSIQDEYIAQCEGLDACDTPQKYGFIADSQKLPENISSPPSSPLLPTQAAPQNVNHYSVTSTTATPRRTSAASIVEQSSISELELPELPLAPAEQQSPLLQEVSPNKTTFKTLSNQQTIPETSPANDTLRPMGDIGMSFGLDVETCQTYPGFSQDEDFNQILNLGLPQSSTDKPVRSMSKKSLAEETRNENTDDVDFEDVIAATNDDLPITASDENTHDPQNYSNKMIEDVAVAMEVIRPVAPPEERGATAADNLGVLDKREVTAIESTLPDNGDAPCPTENERQKTPDVDFTGPPVRKTPLEKVVTPTSTQHVTASSDMSSVPSSAAETPIKKRVLVDKILESNMMAEVVTPTSTPGDAPSRRKGRRQSSALTKLQNKEPTRTSKRRSLIADAMDSPDPLSLLAPSTNPRTRKPIGALFTGMAFAVSYIGREEEKKQVLSFITDNNGEVLEEGFESLFESGMDQDLVISSTGEEKGFVALIADEHSRRTKYMQALALGLPCISGRWIISCVLKDSIIDWSPYQLSAGQSTLLGNVFLSRNIQYYPATTAKLDITFTTRNKILDGKSIMLVTGHANGKRQAYLFLTRASGPAHIIQASNYAEARKKLIEAENKGKDIDMVCADIKPEAADSALFATSVGSARKRKRGPGIAEAPAPKRIRVITNEDMIQSLIMGRLVED